MKKTALILICLCLFAAQNAMAFRLGAGKNFGMQRNLIRKIKWILPQLVQH